MEYSFNFVNISLYQAIEQIVAQENLDFGRIYNDFKVCCKEGFFNVSITVDKDGVWSYVASEMGGDPVLAGVTTYCEDGEIEYHVEILPRDEFNTLKTTADAAPRYEDDHHFNGYVEYEDLLANW